MVAKNFLEEQNPNSGRNEGNWGKREGVEYRREKQNETVSVLGIRILRLVLNRHLGMDIDKNKPM